MPTILSHTLLYIKTSIKSNKNDCLFLIFLGKFYILEVFLYGTLWSLPIFTIFAKFPCACAGKFHLANLSKQRSITNRGKEKYIACTPKQRRLHTVHLRPRITCKKNEEVIFTSSYPYQIKGIRRYLTFFLYSI